MPVSSFFFMLMSSIGIMHMHPETKVTVISKKTDCDRDFMEQSSFQ